jgi:hypothetical protein
MESIIQYFTSTDNFIHHAWFLASLIILAHVIGLFMLFKWAQKDNQKSTLDRMVSDMQKEKRD